MNFGIICEFNPFHNGHAYLLERSRELGAENIICVMSGNSVQRGELAFADKYLRAETAIRCGADITVELPFPWCSASAEYFALAGVRVASELCDNLIFGSECGDIALLREAAELALSDDFRSRYELLKKNGEGAATAYFSLIEEKLGVALNSNDLLGIEYIKAASRLKVGLELHTVRREGNAYNDSELSSERLPSASALRTAIAEGERDFDAYMPSCAAESLQLAIERGETFDSEAFGRACLLFLRLSEPEELSRYAECEGGIANRIRSLALECSDYGEFFEKLRTKRYTDAKLRRAMLFALCKVEASLLSQSPEYTYLLGASEKGRALLSKYKKEKRGEKLTMVTKPADAPRESEQYKAEERLNSIFTLLKASPSPLGDAYRKNAYIK